jgi:hypothetical protein
MRYFFLEPKLNDLTGNTPIVNILPSQDVLDANSIYAFGRIDFPIINHIDYFVLDDKAEFTDVLCAQMLTLTGLLVNQRTLSILVKFKLPEHKIYSFIVKNEIEQREYFWIQTSAMREIDITEYLDFKKSSFEIERKMGQYEPIKIESASHFHEIKSSLLKFQYLVLKSATLRPSFRALNFDLFKISRLNPDWIISEHLKKIIELNNITGIEVKEAQRLIIE